MPRPYASNMFGYTLIPLLIAGLLACPLRCAPGSAVGPSDATVMMSGCSCCMPIAADASGSAGEDLGGGEPQPANEDCECVNCICHGALLQSEADSSQVILHWIVDDLAFRSVIDTVCVVDSSGVCRTNLFSSHGYPSTGRAARIAHQSLLI